MADPGTPPISSKALGAEHGLTDQHIADGAGHVLEALVSADMARRATAISGIGSAIKNLRGSYPEVLYTSGFRCELSELKADQRALAKQFIEYVIALVLDERPVHGILLDPPDRGLVSLETVGNFIIEIESIGLWFCTTGPEHNPWESLEVRGVWKIEPNGGGGGPPGGTTAPNPEIASRFDDELAERGEQTDPRRVVNGAPLFHVDLSAPVRYAVGVIRAPLTWGIVALVLAIVFIPVRWSQGARELSLPASSADAAGIAPESAAIGKQAQPKVESTSTVSLVKTPKHRRHLARAGGRRPER